MLILARNRFFTQSHNSANPGQSSNINSPHRLNMVMEESFASDHQQVIMWGTNINIEDIEKKFEQFLSNFKVHYLLKK